jgi:hypothetical protein
MSTISAAHGVRPAPIRVLKNNREKENDLVATGILPVIPNGQAGSLSHHSELLSDPIGYECKTFQNYHSLTEVTSYILFLSSI